MVFAGCDNKNAFDFSQLDDIDMQGDWGLPLLNAEYTIGDILALADNPNLIQQNSDGSLEIRYEYSFDSLISASEYLDSYINQDISVSGNRTISIADLPPAVGNVQVLYNDTLNVEIPSDKVIIESASLKEGQLNFQVTYNITQTTMLTITCPQLRDASGQIFLISASATGGNYQNTFNIGGYTLTGNADQEIDFYVEVKCNSSGVSLPNELTFSYSASFSHLRFSEIRGKFASVDLPLDKEWDFDTEFLRQHIMGTMTIMNPQVTCEILNTFPVDGNIVLQEAVLSGPGVSGSLLATTPSTIYVPGSTGQFTPVSLPLASSLLLSPDYNHFKLRGNASLNPNGLNTPTLVFREDQLISLRLTVTLPFEISMDNIHFNDTIDFGGISLPSEMGFSNILLRMALYNGLPVNFQMQAYFYDSETNTVKDSLFTDVRTILSAQGNVPRMTELFATKENYSDVQRMFACDKIILSAKLFTEGQSVSINANQSLRVQLSARFNMDVNGLANLGN
jgi:hypothetical protein